MLSTPLIVRAQLSEALSIISMHDFPNKWPDLLPRLIQKLQTGDPATINGVLHTLNSIYKRLRGQMMTDALSIELEVSQQVVQPLLHALEQLTQQVSIRKPGRLALPSSHVTVQAERGAQLHPLMQPSKAAL